MALTIISEAGTGNEVSAASVAVTGVDAAVGDLVAVHIASDNSATGGTSPITGISDSAGNTYSSQFHLNRTPTSSTNDGTSGRLWTTRVTSALVNGTVSITLSPNTTSKAVEVKVATPGAGEAVEVVAADATGQTGTGTSHSANTVSVTNGDTIICFASLETGSADVPVGDADTTNGNWSAIVNRGSGGGAGGAQTTASQYKTVNATGNQTWTITTGSSRDSTRSYIILRAVSAGVSGTAGITEADDTVSATGVIALSGAASITEANHTVAATGTVALTGTASITEADDTVAATGSTGTNGAVGVTEQNDTATATGAIATAATVGATEADDTLAAIGALAIRGEAAIVLAGVTLSASAQLPIFYPRRGGLDEREEFDRRQREWRDDLRRIVDRSWLIAHGVIDPSTFEPIPPPDFSPIIRKLLDQAISLDHGRAEAFIAEQKHLREEEAVAILLLA